MTKGPSETVRWVLLCTVGDTNWALNVQRLTDDELRYCLRHETRRTALKRLQAEAKRRRLEV